MYYYTIRLCKLYDPAEKIKFRLSVEINAGKPIENYIQMVLYQNIPILAMYRAMDHVDTSFTKKQQEQATNV